MNKPVPPPKPSGPPAPRRRRADNAFLAPALEILESPPSPVLIHTPASFAPLESAVTAAWLSAP